MKILHMISNLLVTVGLLFVLTACSSPEHKPLELPDDSSGSVTNDQETITPHDVDTSSDSSQTEPAASEKESVSENSSAPVDLGQFRAILTGEADFLDAFSHETVNISNLSSVFTTDTSTVAVAESFTILDLDEDCMPEVVLQLGPNETWGRLILHAKNEDVYGYWIPSRAMQNLKEDGTFNFSNDAGNSGIGTLSFGDQTYETTELVRSEVLYDADNAPAVLYYINGAVSSQEAFDQEMASQAHKKDAVAFEFTTTTIESYFNS